MISFRSNTKAVPGLEYRTKIYADPNHVKDGTDFLKKVADLKEAKVSSSLYDEDAYSGVLSAIDDIDWSPFGARYMVLITDAGAIDGSNKLSGTGLDASQLRLEAGNRGIAIYTLHLKTSGGKDNHAKAESQYRDLSNFDSTQSNLYQAVNAGDIKMFGQQVDALASAITEQVKSAYMGDAAIGSALYAKDDGQKLTPEQKLLQDTALIDLRETSSLLKSLVSDFGGNAQQLLPITNQLDRISGDGSGINTITQAQDRTPDSVNTSGVMSASRVGELGGSVDSQAKLGLSSNAQDATQHVPGKSEAGFTPYNLDNAGKGDIQGIHNNNVGRTYSDEERNVLNSLEKNGPVLNNQGVEKVVNSGQDVRNAEGTFNDRSRRDARSGEAPGRRYRESKPVVAG